MSTRRFGPQRSSAAGTRLIAKVTSVLAAGPLLHACAGSGGASPNSAVDGLKHATGIVSLHLALPPVSRMTQSQRAVQYVSTATQQLTVVLTPAGGGAQAPLTFACTAASCNATFAAPQGNAHIALTLSDGAGGHVLSITTATPIVVNPSVTNTFNLTANPVVDHVAIVPAAAIVSAGSATAVGVSINAYDADNALIVGPGVFVDTSGRPLTLSVAESDAQAAGGGTAPLAVTSFTGPQTTAVNAAYNGQGVDQLSYTLSSSLPIVGGSAVATITPQAAVVAQYPTSLVSSDYVTPASDGNFWVTGIASGQIAKITPAGAVTTYGGLNGPAGIVQGGDGALWFVERAGNQVGRITLGGSVTLYPIPTANCGAEDITIGADGALWFTEELSGKIGRITTGGILTEYSLPNPASGPFAITSAPDNNIWFTEDGGGLGAIASISTDGTTIHEYPLPDRGTNPEGIAVGPDGNLWFAELFSNKIGYITTGGVITEYTLPNAASRPYRIVNGPDGALWFSDRAIPAIGRITTSGTVSETTITDAGALPNSPVVGPDHELWLTQDITENLAHIVY